MRGLAIVVVPIVLSLVFVVRGWREERRQRRLRTDADYRTAAMQELFDGRQQVTTEITPASLPLPDLLREANDRGYRLVSQVKKDRLTTVVVFDDGKSVSRP